MRAVKLPRIVDIVRALEVNGGQIRSLNAEVASYVSEAKVALSRGMNSKNGGYFEVKRYQRGT